MSEDERTPEKDGHEDDEKTRHGDGKNGENLRKMEKKTSERKNGGSEKSGSKEKRGRSGKDKERSRSKSRSRSRSKSRHSKKRKSHKKRSHSRSRSRSKDRKSRSRSRSRSNRHRSYRKRSVSRSRSRSRSPVNDRRRDYGGPPPYFKSSKYMEREAPAPSRCIGIFGMSLYTDEKQLQRYFSQFGPIENVQIVYDRKSRQSRGFGFVYFEKIDDAIAAKEQAIGTEIDGQRVRIDYSVTPGPHAPTPGGYMGHRGDDRDSGRHGPPMSRRRSRSRS